MKKSIARIGYAPFTFAEGAYTYEAIKWFESEKAGGREITSTPRGDVTEVYADGKAVISVTENDGYDITLQLLDIIDDIEKDWLGNEVKEGAVAEYSTGMPFPKFCLVAVFTQTDGTFKTEYYYQTAVSQRPDRTGKTSEGAFEPAFFDVTLKALPREHDIETKRLVMYTKVSNTMPTAVEVPEV